MSAIKPYLKTLSQPSQLSHCHMYQRFSVGQLAKTKLSHKQNCPKVSSMVAHPFGAVGQLGHVEKNELFHRKVLILLDMGRLGHLGQSKKYDSNRFSGGWRMTPDYELSISPCATLRTKDEPKAAPAVRSKSKPSETPHHGHTPKDVDTMDFLHRLAAIDTNIDALLGWGLVPHLQDGELVIDGMDALDAESRAGLERWLAHAGPNGEPRQERVIRALKTGRRCAA